jgi:hypothetical protein
VADNDDNPATYVPSFIEYSSFLERSVTGERTCAVCGHNRFSVLTDAGDGNQTSVMRLEREEAGSPQFFMRVVAHFCRKCGTSYFTDVMAVMGRAPYGGQ